MQIKVLHLQQKYDNIFEVSDKWNIMLYGKKLRDLIFPIDVSLTEMNDMSSGKVFKDLKNKKIW